MKRTLSLGLLIAVLFISCKKENSNRPATGTRLVKLVQGNNAATDTVCNFTYNAAGQVVSVDRVENSYTDLYALHYNSQGQLDSLYQAEGNSVGFPTKGFSYNPDGTLSEIRINDLIFDFGSRYVFYYNNGFLLGSECYVQSTGGGEELKEYSLYTFENGNIVKLEFYDAEANLIYRRNFTYSSHNNQLKLISLLEDFGPAAGMYTMTGMGFEGFFNRNLVAGYTFTPFSSSSFYEEKTISYSFNSNAQLPIKIETKNLSNAVEETWHLTYE